MALHPATIAVMPYPEPFIAPMRAELTSVGARELRTPDDVDAALREKGTVMIVVNSVCGCAAGKARPGIAMALQHEKRPDFIGTVFAGADIDATARARDAFAPYPPSSPSVGLLRDARVHLDTGLHTGRLTFDQAVDYYTENVDFLPGACKAPESDDIRRASCATARRAIYRYSKWPTQAVTYHLGKASIQALRDEVRKQLGARYDDKRFHELVLSQGTVPPGYFKERVLSQAAGR